MRHIVIEVNFLLVHYFKLDWISFHWNVSPTDKLAWILGSLTCIFFPLPSLLPSLLLSSIYLSINHSSRLKESFPDYWDKALGPYLSTRGNRDRMWEELRYGGPSWQVGLFFRTSRGPHSRGLVTVPPSHSVIVLQGHAVGSARDAPPAGCGLRCSMTITYEGGPKNVICL